VDLVPIEVVLDLARMIPMTVGARTGDVRVLWYQSGSVKRLGRSEVAELVVEGFR
jgi:hypothetical protein